MVETPCLGAKRKQAKCAQSELVIPAKAGIRGFYSQIPFWIPAGVYPDVNRGRND